MDAFKGRSGCGMIQVYNQEVYKKHESKKDGNSQNDISWASCYEIYTDKLYHTNPLKDIQNLYNKTFKRWGSDFLHIIESVHLRVQQVTYSMCPFDHAQLIKLIS